MEAERGGCGGIRSGCGAGEMAAPASAVPGSAAGLRAGAVRFPVPAGARSWRAAAELPTSRSLLSGRRFPGNDPAPPCCSRPPRRATRAPRLDQVACRVASRRGCGKSS